MSRPHGEVGAPGSIALGAAALVATVGLSVLAARRVASSASRRRRERWRLAKGLWRHPERGLHGRRSPAYELARSVLLSGLSALVAIAVRRAAAALLGPAPATPKTSGEGGASVAR